jgi:alkylresorcinol/alkylpyrone synthase
LTYAARMVAIAGVQGVLAPHRYPQPEITRAFGAMVSPDGSHAAAIEKVHAATGVQGRHLALPLAEYPGIEGFGAANDVFIRVGVDLGEQAIRGALAKAGLQPEDVDLLVCTSVTGIAAPSLDSRLLPRLGMRTDVKRLPIFGLGCVAGAAGIARVRDHLLGDPDGVAVLLSVELCSLTLQRDDASMPNIVGSGLFGDGAAAVVMVGAARARRMGIQGPTVLASRSRMYPDTERVMGWDVGGSGFRLVLSADVPAVVAEYLEDDVTGFLADHDLKTPDIARWVCHPGGPRILTAMEDALDLHDGELDVTWRSLARIGNLSSSSVLHVLQDTIEGRDGTTPAEPGATGLLMALGPGFCAELVLLRW